MKVDGAMFGRLRVSRGAIEWFPRSAQIGGYQLSWEAFADLMTTNGRRKK